MAENRGGKKGRKIGRNKKWCEAYRARSQREINKLRKMRKELKFRRKKEAPSLDLRERIKAYA